MTRWLVLVITVAGCSASSDGGTCPQGGSLQVNVTDTNSGDPICDASVTIAAQGGGPSKTLSPEPPPPVMPTPGCNYFILVTPGMYTITVSRSGYMTDATPLTVTTDGCTIESPTVDIPLIPLAAP
jgi:hypothetical protein